MKKHKNVLISNIPTESLRKYLMLGAKEKLDWLEETFNFTKKYVSKEKLRLWEKLRRG